eukprot:365536-Chlamydomonas_euryale.AAC.4
MEAPAALASGPAPAQVVSISQLALRRPLTLSACYIVLAADAHWQSTSQYSRPAMLYPGSVGCERCEACSRLTFYKPATRELWTACKLPACYMLPTTLASQEPLRLQLYTHGMGLLFGPSKSL